MISLEKALVGTGSGVGSGVGVFVAVGVAVWVGVGVAVGVLVAAIRLGSEVRAAGRVDNAVSVGVKVDVGEDVGVTAVGEAEGTSASSLLPQPATMAEADSSSSNPVQNGGLCLLLLGWAEAVGF